MRNQGFSLLEMIITLMLLVVGLTAILQMLSTGMSVEASTAYVTVALMLGEEKMEEIKNAFSYASINSYASSRSALSDGFEEYEREVLVAGDPKQVDVNVYWSEKGQEQSIRLTSVFADYD